jgi:hypothetical protein
MLRVKDRAWLVAKRAVALAVALIPGLFVGMSAFLIFAFFRPAHPSVRPAPLGDVIYWAASMMIGAYQNFLTFLLVGLPIPLVYGWVVRADPPFLKIGAVGVLAYVLAICLADQPMNHWLTVGSLHLTLTFQLITLVSLLLSAPIARKLGALT